MAPLRIGILGAARIAPAALVKPARRVGEVQVVAVAARDPARAEHFARRQRIATVHRSYDELLADPHVDAVYNPLPNGLHGRWTIAALRAGKHVLCEKPFTANADEAQEVADVAAHTGLVVMEAFHYRYHPLSTRMVEIVRGGELGAVHHLESWMCTALFSRDDIRWQLLLAGGSAMDLGCYTIHLLRMLAGEEPLVTRARAKVRCADVDRWLRADLRFPDGRTGRITAAMLSRRPLAVGARVVGDDGELRVLNPYAPQYFHRLAVRTGHSKRVEHLTREPSYLFQLRAFAGAVLRGEPVPTGPEDSIATMRVVDAAYRAAGLPVRQPTATPGGSDAPRAR